MGLLAAGIATAATGGPAQAAEGIAVTHDDVRTVANPHHHVAYDDSFAVHQLGSVTAARVGNQAIATSAGCTADDACRSVALSFQVVTLAGDHVRLNAINNGRARNEHCTGCQTLAGAYQFVVSTPKPTRLTPTAQRRLADIHRRLDALGSSRLPAADLKRRADALAAEVTALLAQPSSMTAGTAPHTRPSVTVHRHLDGWPAH
ncbi:hypothetical protein BLA24_18560 [Streptomyces cinnamoneus]|uniref:Uncharacterized protein n=1 Tax=Streptomyces cinnamoneus TaxID=53446 RepID=A0A2G1XIF2_STRCJ|nr:hypothetical protein BLA24_18560 [Streptomyces cinnamoneus]PPT16566.1 hypothetical protein CYQ11_14720 [Streptomyces cinnamoneus]